MSFLFYAICMFLPANLVSLYIFMAAKQFTDPDRINPYNRYKILYNRREKYYYVKFIKTRLFPVYVSFTNHSHYPGMPYDFYDHDNGEEILRFKTYKEAKYAIECAYYQNHDEEVDECISDMQIFPVDDIAIESRHEKHLEYTKNVLSKHTDKFIGTHTK